MHDVALAMDVRFVRIVACAGRQLPEIVRRVLVYGVENYTYLDKTVWYLEEVFVDQLADLAW